MNRNFRPPKLTYWANKSKWTIQEFVFLLHGYEPAILDEEFDEDSVAFKETIARFRTPAFNCPGIHFHESHPLLVPIKKQKVIRWAQNLKGVEVPTWMTELPVKRRARSTFEEPTPLGDREKENLLFTIGVLAMALVKATGPDSGTMDTPNVSGIYRICEHLCDGKSGMSNTAMRDRITDGIRRFKNK